MNNVNTRRNGNTLARCKFKLKTRSNLSNEDLEQPSKESNEGQNPYWF